ncbi:MAG: hypothetical protein SH817_09220 [Leptospira sp.]|nr:hypothetical protein [Leptospira sp.]
MGSCVLFLEHQKAKLICFPKDSDLISEELNFQNENSLSYYNDLVTSIGSTSELILIGPDEEEKGNFRRWLLTHKRNLGNRLVAVLPASSMTLEIAKKYKNKYLR